MNCSLCSNGLKKLRTNFSIFLEEGDVVIKNYPIYICSRCGSMDIANKDRKKTVHFLKQHKQNGYKKLS